jgi:c-di-GMP-binding flagellar brake protein YcgR
MRFNQILELGDLMEIHYKDMSVRTKLQEILSDTEIVVLQPTYRGVPLNDGEHEAVISFYRPNGCYLFKARLSPPYEKNGIRLCRVVRVSECERIQRRRYYRLPIVLDVYLYELDAVGEPLDKMYRAKSRDLSEKSIAVTCLTGFAAETPLAVEIVLSDTERVRLRSSVLKCQKLEQPRGVYDIVLLFTDYQKKDRERIRRFIYNKQVQIRKKDLQ